MGIIIAGLFFGLIFGILIEEFGLFGMLAVVLGLVLGLLLGYFVGGIGGLILFGILGIVGGYYLNNILSDDFKEKTLKIIGYIFISFVLLGLIYLIISNWGVG